MGSGFGVKGQQRGLAGVRGQGSLTSGEANGHHHLGGGGEQGGVGGVIERRLGVKLALRGQGSEVKAQRSATGLGGRHGVTHRVKGRQVKGRGGPAQEEFLRRVEAQLGVEGKLGRGAVANWGGLGEVGGNWEGGWEGGGAHCGGWRQTGRDWEQTGGH